MHSCIKMGNTICIFNIIHQIALYATYITAFETFFLVD